MEERVWIIMRGYDVIRGGDVIFPMEKKNEKGRKRVKGKNRGKILYSLQRSLITIGTPLHHHSSPLHTQTTNGKTTNS